MKKFLIFTIAAFIGLQGFTCSNCAARRVNPFFKEWTTPFGVPPFNEIRAEHFMPAYQAGIAEQAAEVWAIIRNQEAPTFQNTIAALDRSGALLRRVTPVFNGILSVNSTPELQSLARQFSPMLSDHNDNINLNPHLFQRIKAVYDQRDRLDLTVEQRRLLENTYNRFDRNGANLSPAQQEQLRKINSQLSGLEVQFTQNVLAEIAGYQLVVTDRTRLGGLTVAQLTEAQSRAQRAGHQNAWVFGLDNPSVMPFLHNADDRALRQEILHAFSNRNNNNDNLDNKEIIRQLLTLRLERAKLLGFNNFAQLINTERMPESPQAVMDFLNKVWTPSLAVAKNELRDIEEEMRRMRVPLPSTAGDWRYFFNKSKERRLRINQTQISEHFQIDNVREGIFYVCNRLWGITFVQLHDIPVPHPEAIAWKVLDRDGTTVLGVVYEDMHPRPGLKNGGAWCGAYRVTSYDKDDKRIIPIVTLAGNFTRASGNKPALLTPDEVGTYFHEWGHGLYHLFSEARFFGTSRPQLDFIEFPSQIMEHWAFQPEVLRVYAKHYRTGRPISNALIRQIEQNEQYGEGFRMAEYLISAFIDMEAHMLPEIPKDFCIVKFEYQIREKIGAIPQIPARHRPTHFRHIFHGQYLAGYYMYRYAEQFDSDAFEAFLESGDIFNQELARKIRFDIFARGGIEDAMILYKNFRGREPDPNALLRSRGLIR